MRILLDTCTFLWLGLDHRELSPMARELFQSPENEVFLSPVSAWEIAVKNGLGRLDLPDPPDQYVPALRRRLGVESLPIDEESALQISRLPDLHRDPFDRMLIGQAIVGGLALLTPDPHIRKYPVRVLW